MAEIREICKADKDRLEYIVVETASGIYKNKPEVTKLLFCDYYIDNGIGYALVENDIVVGYILCSEDYKKYVDIFTKDYLPKVKQIDKKEYILKRLEMLLDRVLGKFYPAHLHIDILEEYCGGGNGTKLMEALLYRLKEDNIKGVWLGVDKNNTRAISFYKKMGFKTNLLAKSFGIYKKRI